MNIHRVLGAVEQHHDDLDARIAAWHTRWNLATFDQQLRMVGDWQMAGCTHLHADIASGDASLFNALLANRHIDVNERAKLCKTAHDDLLAGILMTADSSLTDALLPVAGTRLAHGQPSARLIEAVLWCVNPGVLPPTGDHEWKTIARDAVMRILQDPSDAYSDTIGYELHSVICAIAATHGHTLYEHTSDPALLTTLALAGMHLNPTQLHQWLDQLETSLTADTEATRPHPSDDEIADAIAAVLCAGEGDIDPNIPTRIRQLSAKTRTSTAAASALDELADWLDLRSCDARTLDTPQLQLRGTCSHPITCARHHPHTLWDDPEAHKELLTRDCDTPKLRSWRNLATSQPTNATVQLATDLDSRHLLVAAAADQLTRSGVNLSATFDTATLDAAWNTATHQLANTHTCAILAALAGHVTCSAIESTPWQVIVTACEAADKIDGRPLWAALWRSLDTLKNPDQWACLTGLGEHWTGTLGELLACACAVSDTAPTAPTAPAFA